MKIARPWIVAAGTTLAVAGFGAYAVASPVELNDARPAPVLHLAGGDGAVPAGLTDASAESADSAGASAVESADSPHDSPGDAGWVDPSPESADSPGDSPFDSADSPHDSPDDPGFAPPPPPTPPVAASASADSPVRAPIPAGVLDHSADSAASTASAGSADSAD